MPPATLSLFLAGLVGAFLTSLYTFRLIFVVFHGKAKTEAHAGQGVSHHSAAVGAAGALDICRRVDHSSVERRAARHGYSRINGKSPSHDRDGGSCSSRSPVLPLAALLFLGERRFVTALANSATRPCGQCAMAERWMGL
jgi:NADH-quinone oxidoreductase subunit L